MVKYKMLNFDFCFKIEDDECMKILYCYWMQYNDVNSRGGGTGISTQYNQSIACE